MIYNKFIRSLIRSFVPDVEEIAGHRISARLFSWFLSHYPISPVVRGTRHVTSVGCSLSWDDRPSVLRLVSSCCNEIQGVTSFG